MVEHLKAELYALTHRGNSGDVEFYVSACAGARSVLELGAGYGRLLSALGRPRRRVVGLELDPGMLALGRKNLRASVTAGRDVTLLAGDMQSFDLPGSFERVLVPYNALYCLLSQRSLRSCLRSVRGALSRDGQLVFDVWNADRLERVQTRAGEEEPLVMIEHGGRKYTVYEQARARGPQRLDVTYRYVSEPRGATTSICIRQRYFRPRELFQLLEQEGFEVRSKAGDFAGARFGARSQRLVVTAGLLSQQP